jgi:hypothetical protein
MLQRKHIKAPSRYDPGKGMPTERLIYAAPWEMELLRQLTDGTISVGPKGIPSFVAPPSGGSQTKTNYNSGPGTVSSSGPTGGQGSNYSASSGYNTSKSPTSAGSKNTGETKTASTTSSSGASKTASSPSSAASKNTGPSQGPMSAGQPSANRGVSQSSAPPAASRNPSQGPTGGLGSNRTPTSAYSTPSAPQAPSSPSGGTKRTTGPASPMAGNPSRGVTIPSAMTPSRPMTRTDTDTRGLIGPESPAAPRATTPQVGADGNPYRSYAKISPSGIAMPTQNPLSNKDKFWGREQLTGLEKKGLLSKVVSLQEAYGKPIGITDAQNSTRSKKTGSSTKSKHIPGEAMDLSVPTQDRAQLARLATDLGFGGLGAYGRSKNMLHVDIRKGDPMAWGPNRSWTGIKTLSDPVLRSALNDQRHLSAPKQQLAYDPPKGGQPTKYATMPDAPARKPETPLETVRRSEPGSLLNNGGLQTVANKPGKLPSSAVPGGVPSKPKPTKSQVQALKPDVAPIPRQKPVQVPPRDRMDMPPAPTGTWNVPPPIPRQKPADNGFYDPLGSVSIPQYVAPPNEIPRQRPADLRRAPPRNAIDTPPAPTGTWKPPPPRERGDIPPAPTGDWRGPRPEFDAGTDPYAGRTAPPRPAFDAGTDPYGGRTAGPRPGFMAGPDPYAGRTAPPRPAFDAGTDPYGGRTAGPIPGFEAGPDPYAGRTSPPVPRDEPSAIRDPSGLGKKIAGAIQAPGIALNRLLSGIPTGQDIRDTLAGLPADARRGLSIVGTFPGLANNSTVQGKAKQVVGDAFQGGLNALDSYIKENAPTFNDYTPQAGPSDLAYSSPWTTQSDPAGTGNRPSTASKPTSRDKSSSERNDAIRRKKIAQQLMAGEPVPVPIPVPPGAPPQFGYKQLTDAEREAALQQLLGEW